MCGMGSCSARGARALCEVPIVKPTLQAFLPDIYLASDLVDAAYQTATV